MENITKKISLLGMAGIIIYLYYQISFGSIQDAVNNIVIIILLYNSFLILGSNIKHRRKGKVDIAFSILIVIMALTGSYWWLSIKGFI